MKLLTYELGVNKIAESTSIALTLTMLATLSLSEICDQTEFRLNCLIVIKSSLHRFKACTRLLLGGVFNVYISNHVITNVVCHNDI